MYKKGLNLKKIKGGILSSEELKEYDGLEIHLLNHVHDLQNNKLQYFLLTGEYIDEYNEGDNTNNVISTIDNIIDTLNEEKDLYSMINKLDKIYESNQNIFNNKVKGNFILMKRYLELYNKNVKTNEEEGKIEIKPQLKAEYFIKNSLIVLWINKLYNSLTDYKMIDVKDNDIALIKIINNVFNFFINNIVIKSIIDAYTLYDKSSMIYYYDPNKKGRGRKALDTKEINFDEDLFLQVDDSIKFKIQAKLLGKTTNFEKMILEVDNSIKYIVSKEYRPTLIKEIENIKNKDVLKMIKTDLLIISRLLQIRKNDTNMTEFLFSLVKPIEDIENNIKEIIKVPEPVFDMDDVE